MRVIGDSWALDRANYPYTRIDAFLAGALGRLPAALRRSSLVRSIALALLSSRFDRLAIVHSNPLGRSLTLVFGVLGIRKIIFYETIIRSASSGASLRNRVLAWLLRRSCRELHVMVAGDVPAYAAAFGFPVDHITFVPWPMITGDNFSGMVPLPLAERRIVLSSGRASCDWETLLAAAEGQGWPLVIVCSAEDLPRIKDNPLSQGVEIRSEISRAEHEELVKSARLYILSLAESNISSGQIRLSHCSEFRTPLIASDVYGLRGYLEDGVTGIAVPPGDPIALRRVANELLSSHDRLKAIVDASARFGEGKTIDHYTRSLVGLIR
jgi:hypothetical protein